MNDRRFTVLVVLLGALILALVLGVPTAGAATLGLTGGGSGTTWDGAMMGDDWCAGGFWSGSGAWGGTGTWGTAFGGSWLRNHPSAFDAWLTLRTDHMAELRDWFAQYRADLRSPDAQAALQALWQDHWNDMKAFYQQYANGTTWVCPALTIWGGGMMGGQWMWGTGYGAGWLMRHPGAFASWQALRTKQVNQVRAWWTKHRGHPFSATAQEALSAMRSHHKAQDLTFMADRHITSNTAWSYRGWMGLGGTWGGWGW